MPTVAKVAKKATRTDAETLAQAYVSLSEADKAVKTTIRKAKETIAQGGDVDHASILAAVEASLKVWEAGRKTVAGLPDNTRAPGGATRQSVIMETLGAVNRTLGARLTTSEAKALNRASFKG
jgi:hypothetical protein